MVLTVEPALDVLDLPSWLRIDCRSVLLPLLLLLLLEDACNRAERRVMAAWTEFVADFVYWFCKVLSNEDAAVLKVEMEFCANFAPWARCRCIVCQGELPNFNFIGTRWNPDIAIASRRYDKNGWLMKY